MKPKEKKTHSSYSGFFKAFHFNAVIQNHKWHGNVVFLVKIWSISFGFLLNTTRLSLHPFDCATERVIVIWWFMKQTIAQYSPVLAPALSLWSRFGSSRALMDSVDSQKPPSYASYGVIRCRPCNLFGMLRSSDTKRQKSENAKSQDHFSKEYMTTTVNTFLS